jgi:hypothetical protein
VPGTHFVAVNKWSTWAQAANAISPGQRLRWEITIFNARQHGMTTESAVSAEHVTNHRAVRDTLVKRGIQPGSLPAAEDVKKVERRLASEEKKSLKNPDCLPGDEDSK